MGVHFDHRLVYWDQHDSVIWVLLSQRLCDHCCRQSSCPNLRIFHYEMWSPDPHDWRDSNEVVYCTVHWWHILRRLVAPNIPWENQCCNTAWQFQADNTTSRACYQESNDADSSNWFPFLAPSFADRYPHCLRYNSCGKPDENRNV